MYMLCASCNTCSYLCTVYTYVGVLMANNKIILISAGTKITKLQYIKNGFIKAFKNAY